ncbi:hypothetical protein PTMSG1_08440 [Pyrenophora teres f. maculata]|nr:hypothetical protein PTMSG1_08440 [Pyrenophora teres f. maculata]
MCDSKYDQDIRLLNVKRVRRTVHEYHIPQLPHTRLLPGCAALERDLSKLEELRQEWRKFLAKMCGEDEFLAEMCRENEFLAEICGKDEEFLAKMCGEDEEFLAKMCGEDEEFLAQMCGEDEDRLIEEIKRCGQELQQVNLKARASSDAFGKLLLATAKTDCLALATSVHAALPQEIRDHVYSFLQPSVFDIEDELLRSALKFDDEVEAVAKAFQKQTRHWFLPDAVGFDFAHECAKIHFEKTTFVFLDHGIKHIKMFLHQTLYQLRLKPTAHIRRCRVVFNAFPNRFPDDSEFSIWKNSLNHLCRLKQASATVEFIIVVGDSDLEVYKLHFLLNQLVFLSPILCHLRRREISFTVKLSTFLSRLPEVDITYMWFTTRGVPMVNNGSPTFRDLEDNDDEALMQRFRDWKQAVEPIYRDRDLDYDVRNYNRDSETLREGGVVLDNDADYQFLSHLMMTGR